jgi:hypothetical protein
MAWKPPSAHPTLHHDSHFEFQTPSKKKGKPIRPSWFNPRKQRQKIPRAWLVMRCIVTPHCYDWNYVKVKMITLRYIVPECLGGVS